MEDQKENIFWAKIGRMSVVIEEQGRILDSAQNTIAKLEEYLDDKSLREDFLEWAERKAQEVDKLVLNDSVIQTET